MRKYTVVMESYDCENSKRVQVLANSECDAMAAAQTCYPNWIAVEAIDLMARFDSAISALKAS